MTCRPVRDLILDLARDTGIAEPARRAAEAHVETCAACAAELARQRQLNAALQALADDAQEWSAPAGVEERVLAAFETSAAPSAAPHRAGFRRWPQVLATAAAIALVAWTGMKETGEPANRGTGEVKATGEPARATGEPANRPFDSAPPRSGQANRPAVSERAGQASRTAAKDAVAPVEFVRIPSAIGLPELESGTVVRMELALTALPEYGLDIAPDAVRTSVEADVLVGQDGQPRAIRLVGIPEAVAQDSRSRR